MAAGLYHRIGGLVICRWNDNVVTAQIHNRFIAYILFLHALAGWCQFRVGPLGLAVTYVNTGKSCTFGQLILNSQIRQCPSIVTHQKRSCRMKVSPALQSFREYQWMNSEKKYAQEL